jgi:cell division protein FtsZ
MAINSPLLDVSIHGAKGVLFSIAANDDLLMFEIQDAAKIITESADPNAKIIFGTVYDEKIKKGEVRVTVVAAGFPDGAPKKSLFEGKIFNSLGASDAKPEAPSASTASTPPPANKAEKKDEEEEDEWSAVPAFLRRSKLK